MTHNTYNSKHLRHDPPQVSDQLLGLMLVALSAMLMSSTTAALIVYEIMK